MLTRVNAMRFHWHTLSLRIRMTIIVAGLLILPTTLGELLAFARLSSLADELSRHRRQDISSVLARALVPALASGDRAAAAWVLTMLEATAGAESAVVYGTDRSVLAAWNTDAPPPLRGSLGDMPAHRMGDAWAAVLVRIDDGERELGVLRVAFSTAQPHAERTRDVALLFGIWAAVLLAALAVTFLLGTWLAGPVVSLSRQVSDLVTSGDLTQRVEARGQGEVLRLATSYNALVRNQRTILVEVKEMVAGLTHAVTRMGDVAAQASKSATEIQAQVRSTSTTMQSTLESLRATGNDVSVLLTNAEQTAQSTNQMVATNAAVAKGVDRLFSSIEAVTEAIEKMNETTRQEASDVENLNRVVSTTSASMTQMDHSIGQVQANASQTAELAQRLAEDANRGVRAVKLNVEGFDMIRESARTAADVIEWLGENVAKIDAILTVIDHIAGQTSLLALNAAILAARAGEHGRGFAVVADSVKALSTRTRQSTGEVATLIGEIQTASNNAVLMMRASLQNVEEGVRRGGEAEAVLHEIRESAARFNTMAQEIAAGTKDQVRASQHVTKAVRRVAGTVDNINRAFRKHAGGAEQIVASITQIQAFADQVRQSVQQQNEHSQQILLASDDVHRLVASLRDTQHQQTQDSEQTLEAVEAIHDTSAAQADSFAVLEATLSLLETRSQALVGEVSRFRV